MDYRSAYVNITKKNLPIMMLVITTILLAGCVTNIHHRGYLTGGINIDQLKTGMTQSQVTNLLGSPSMTAIIEKNNDAYYYVSDTIKYTVFFKPELVEREILAIRFNSNGRVRNILHYDISDSKVIDFVSDKTEVRGKELSIIEQLIGNIGRFEPQ